MLPGEAELVSEWTGLSGKAKSVKRFERSNGLDTALYKNYRFNVYIRNFEFLTGYPLKWVGLQQMSSINVLTGFFKENMKYEKKKLVGLPGSARDSGISSQQIWFFPKMLTYLPLWQVNWEHYSPLMLTHLTVWPPFTDLNFETPKNAPNGSRGPNFFLPNVHSQMNLQTCAKFGVNRSSRSAASPDFWIVDPLNHPNTPFQMAKYV